jgi:DMSO/TMAO reductase YedYZ molybdopterin-dependent catalytic subunit
MSDQGERPAAKRRTFLKLLGLGGAAGAAALASGGTATGEASELEQRETGYRETAHVRKFYETAKF